MNASMRCSDSPPAFRSLVWALLRGLALALGLLMASLPAAWAHKASDAYVLLDGTADGGTLRVDVALRDLDVVVDIDADADGKLTWGEIRATLPAIERLVRAQVQVAGCPLGASTQALERRADGVYAALNFGLSCRLQAEPLIRYTLLADVDPTHRGIARIAVAGHEAVVRVLDPGHPNTLQAPTGTSSLPDALGSAGAPGLASSPADSSAQSFLREGVRHILGGYDHVLFLLCLLFPAVMRRTASGWQPVQRLRDAVWPVLGIVTAFTVAHSITLTLAAMKWVALPPSFIEPAIAFTIMLAALNNIVPIFRDRLVPVTFAFGLVHGFGFANVLSELQLPTAKFALALLEFNVGLELGQVMIVLVATSLMYLARRRTGYVAWVIHGGSCAAMGVALLWFVERTANVSLMPL